MQMNNIIYNKEELYKPILAGICIKFALLMLSEFIIIGFIEGDDKHDIKEFIGRFVNNKLSMLCFFLVSIIIIGLSLISNIITEHKNIIQKHLFIAFINIMYCIFEILQNVFFLMFYYNNKFHVMIVSFLQIYELIKHIDNIKNNSTEYTIFNIHIIFGWINTINTICILIITIIYYDNTENITEYTLFFQIIAILYMYITQHGQYKIENHKGLNENHIEYLNLKNPISLLLYMKIYSIYYLVGIMDYLVDKLYKKID